MDSETPTIVIDNSYPILYAGTKGNTNWLPQNSRGLYASINGSIVCKIPYNPPYDTSKMIICLKDAAVNPKIVFMSIPLNRMDKIGNNATYFLRKIIGIDFGIHN